MERNLNSLFTNHLTQPDALNMELLLQGVTKYAKTMALSWRHASPDDAAQDITLKVWQTLPSFQGRASFKTWTHGVARRLLLNQAVALKRKGTTSQLDDQETAPEYRAEVRSFCIDKLPSLRDCEVGVLESLIITGDFAAAALDLGLTQKALRCRLDRILKKVSLPETIF